MDNSLILPNVGRQDSGQYVCNATNHLGTSEVTIMLEVDSEYFEIICKKLFFFVTYLYIICDIFNICVNIWDNICDI